MPELAGEELKMLLNKYLKNTMSITLNASADEEEKALKICEEYINNGNIDIHDMSPLSIYYIISKLPDERQIEFIQENINYIKENDEEKKQKVKTIDELLKDTADVEINVDKNDKNKNNTSRNVSDELDDYEKIDEDLEEIIPENKGVQEEKIDDEDDDTLENDLFELIDSMYDNREDGDY